MLTNKECTRILNKEGKKYTEQEIKQISELIELFALITVKEFKK